MGAILLIAAAITASPDCRCAIPLPDSLVTVLVETEFGDIVVQLDLENAPISGSNFLRYVDTGLYAGGTFYRTVRDANQPNDSVRIAVIQGGMDRDRRADRFDPIRLEGTRETGLPHLDGTISMARAGPDTARAEFFICIGDQPELDERGRRHVDGLGFAAFGRVISGMDVVRRIHEMTADGQRITPPVRILGTRRVTS